MKILPFVCVRSAKASRKATNRRFVPENPCGSSPTRLEGRFLTAPAFWRYPYGHPLEANDNTWTTGVGGITVGEFSSNSSLNQTAGPPVISDWSGSTTSFITDVGDPASPAPPVGTYAVSMGAASDLHWSGTPGAGLFDTEAGGHRSYQIATDGTGSATGWAVFETLTITYSGPPSSDLPSRWIALTYSVTTPGMQITGGGGNSLGGATIDGTTVANGLTGSFTTSGGNLVTYTSTGSEAYFTVKTPLATLSPASTNPVSGLGWDVSFHMQMGLWPRTSGATSLDQNFSMAYHASFVNV